MSLTSLKETKNIVFDISSSQVLQKCHLLDIETTATSTASTASTASNTSQTRLIVFEGKKAKDSVKPKTQRKREKITQKCEEMNDITILETLKQLRLLDALKHIEITGSLNKEQITPLKDKFNIDVKDLPKTLVLMRSEIKRKISSYRHQDIEKNKLDESLIVKYNDVLDLLIKSKLQCYYCNEHMFVLYEQVRAGKQWSLDRINNDIGHNRGNLVIACLSCNLKRRVTDDEKFLFTKQLKISKLNINSNTNSNSNSNSNTNSNTNSNIET